MGRVPGGVYSSAFWGNGCNYRNITDVQHITAARRYMVLIFGGKRAGMKTAACISNGGEGVTHAESNNRRRDYSGAVYSVIHRGMFGACSRWGFIAVYFGVIGAIFA